MIKLEKFDGNKTYMFPNGQVATPEEIRKQFPAVDQFVHVIEVNGEVCQAVMNLNALRNIHKIDEKLSEEDAIAAIEVIMNTPPEEVITPEERTAAAQEFANLALLPDVVEETETLEDDKIIKRNVEKGLWSASHLQVAVKKGLITQAHADTIVADITVK